MEYIDLKYELMMIDTIDLVITSPPGISEVFHNSIYDLDTYIDYMYQIFSTIHSCMNTNGKLCINLINDHISEYSTYRERFNQMMISIGYILRDEIIWDQSVHRAELTGAPPDPMIRDDHEFVLVYALTEQRTDNVVTNNDEEYLEFSRSVWRFPKYTDDNEFNLNSEFAYRCIKLYSEFGDMILDIFSRFGLTAITAISNARRVYTLTDNQIWLRYSQERVDDLFEYNRDNIDLFTSLRNTQLMDMKKMAPCIFCGVNSDIMIKLSHIYFITVCEIHLNRYFHPFDMYR